MFKKVTEAGAKAAASALSKPTNSTFPRFYSGLYTKGFNLPAKDLKEVYSKSARLGAIKNHLKLQPDNFCALTVAETLVDASKSVSPPTPAPSGPPDLESFSLADYSSWAFDKLKHEQGPSGPADGKTLSERMADTLMEKVKSGPVELHQVGIGGVGGGAYGKHAILIADVVYPHAIIIDPNDRSEHPLIKAFKEKNPDIALDKLTPAQIRENGLDEAMIYAVPLKEMIELSLLEHCEHVLGLQKNLQESRGISVDLLAMETSGTSIYTLGNPPPDFTKPDKGLKEYVKQLQDQGKLITQDELRKEIQEKKVALKVKFPDTFENAWNKVHGQEKSNSNSRSL